MCFNFELKNGVLPKHNFVKPKYHYSHYLIINSEIHDKFKSTKEESL